MKIDRSRYVMKGVFSFTVSSDTSIPVGYDEHQFKADERKNEKTLTNTTSAQGLDEKA
jgi:hypothetical protein